jgi:hypothetical protein
MKFGVVWFEKEACIMLMVKSVLVFETPETLIGVQRRRDSFA